MRGDEAENQKKVKPRISSPELEMQSCKKTALYDQNSKSLKLWTVVNFFWLDLVARITLPLRPLPMLPDCIHGMFVEMEKDATET